jgi:hypothetical protein
LDQSQSWPAQVPLVEAPRRGRHAEDILSELPVVHAGSLLLALQDRDEGAHRTMHRRS